MIHLYESHLGGYYTTDHYIKDTYCDQCGDSDTYLGEFKTEEEAKNYFIRWFDEVYR